MIRLIGVLNPHTTLTTDESVILGFQDDTNSRRERKETALQAVCRLAQRMRRIADSVRTGSATVDVYRCLTALILEHDGIAIATELLPVFRTWPLTDGNMAPEGQNN